MEHSPPNVAEAREAATEIAADAARATEMLHAVRQIFARRDEEQTRFDANRLVEEAIAMLRSELKASAIGVQLQLSRPLPEIVANRAQLQEVIVNLVHNAADAMRGITDHATVLSISTRREADRVEITVADTGSGIAAQDLERIFDAFFTTKPSGFGMGLAICKSIVERHGGTLSAARADPFGSVFRVVLPCAA
jgi:signal transduction histidine kinase